MDYLVHGVTKGRTRLSDFHFSVFYTLVWVFEHPCLFKLVLEKAEEPEIKLPTSSGCCWVFAMTSAFSWQNSISLWPASFRIPRPNLPITPGVS